MTAGDKQIIGLTLPDPPFWSKKRTFPEKKNSVGFIFWSILNEFLFRGLCVVVVFGFDIACILVTRPSFRAKLF